MYENSDSVFDLQLDTQSQEYLLATAKWGRFLSIVGFIFMGLMVVVGLFMGTIFSSLPVQTTPSPFAGFGATFLMLVYIVIALIYFFPCLYLYRFSSRMIKAAASRDQNTFVSSLSQLKSCFKFIGILTIVILSIYALVFVFSIVAGVGGLMH